MRAPPSGKSEKWRKHARGSVNKQDRLENGITNKNKDALMIYSVIKNVQNRKGICLYSFLEKATVKH